MIETAGYLQIKGDFIHGHTDYSGFIQPAYPLPGKHQADAG